MKISHKILQTIVFIVLSAKIQLRVFNFFEKSHKLIHFCNFLKKSFENFQNFLASGGLRPPDALRPPDPLRSRPLKCPPPNRNPGADAVYVLKKYSCLTYLDKMKSYNRKSIISTIPSSQKYRISFNYGEISQF